MEKLLETIGVFGWLPRPCLGEAKILLFGCLVRPLARPNLTRSGLARVDPASLLSPFSSPPPRRSLPQHPRNATDLHQLLHRAVSLTTAESASLLRRLLVAHPHSCLGRLLQELAGLRLRGGEVKAALASDPEGLLSMDPGEPSRLLNLLRDLRCREAVRDQILAHGALRAAVAARRRVDLLRVRGLTCHDALRVLVTESRAMLYPPEDVERKVKSLVETMGFEVGWLVQYPEFLGVNLGRWIISRHNVVEHLKSVTATRSRFPVLLLLFVGVAALMASAVVVTDDEICAQTAAR